MDTPGESQEADNPAKSLDEAELKEVCGKVVSQEGDFMSNWVR